MTQYNDNVIYNIDTVNKIVYAKATGCVKEFYDRTFEIFNSSMDDDDLIMSLKSYIKNFTIKDEIKDEYCATAEYRSDDSDDIDKGMQLAKMRVLSKKENAIIDCWLTFFNNISKMKTAMFTNLENTVKEVRKIDSREYNLSKSM